MINLRGKTILVTGGAGFVGSYLCDELLNQEARVIALDNLFTGSEDNLVVAKKQNDFLFIKGDANNYKFLHSVFSEHKIDYIFHYAAILGVKRVMEEPLLVLDDIRGLKNILSLAREFKVKKVVYASSSEAYGDSRELPLTESGVNLADHTSASQNMYALVKVIGEKMMKIYNDMYNVPTCSLRFFNVFGPRQESSAYGFVVGVFMKQVLNNQNPTVFGDGYQTRDFIYIKDNVRLAIAALLTDKTNGEVINIGVGRQTTIRDLAERIVRISGKDLEIKYEAGRPYEIKYRAPDVTKMRELLKETIEDKLDANLKKTYEWYQQK